MRIPDKAAAALLPSDNRGVFVVPAANFHEAQQHASGLDIREVSPAQLFGKAVNQAPAIWDAPPRAEDDLAVWLEYTNRPHIAGDRRQRSIHYGELVWRLGEEKHKEWQKAGGAPITRLAVPLSLNHEATLCSIASLKPDEVCVLVTEEAEKEYAEFKAKVGDRAVISPLPVKIKAEPFDPEPARDELETWLRASGASAVDITSGTREVSWICLSAAERAGAAILFTKTDYVSATAPKNGTERIVRLPPIRGLG